MPGFSFGIVPLGIPVTNHVCITFHHLSRMILYRFPSLIAAIAAMTFSLQAQPVPVDSEITAATVFQDAAVVTRVATVELTAGSQTLLFDRLPGVTQPESFQVEVEGGDGKVVVREIQFQRTQGPVTSPKIEALEATLKALQAEIKALGDRQTLATKEMAFAEKLAEAFTQRFARGGAEDQANLALARSTWEYTQSVLMKQGAVVSEIETKLVTLRETAKKTEQELNEARQSAGQLRGGALVTLEAAQPVKATVALKYLVNGCSWNPRYELRAEPESGTITLRYLGAVVQRTGEDWNAIPLILSTSEAMRSGNVPELMPLYLNPVTASPRKESLARSALMSDAPPAPAFASDAVTVEQGFSRFQASLNRPTSVPSGNQAVTVSLMEETVPAGFWTEIVPLLREEGYLIAQSKNPFALPLLPGEAQVFVEGKLVSRVWLAYTLPDNEMELSLGIDELISVARREGGRMERQTGLIDRTITQQRTYFTDVTNFHTLPHKVKVVDRFPVSQNQRIEVKRLAPPASAVELDADTGVFHWTATLKPKEKKTFETRFDVIYPRDWNVPMLP